MRAIDADALQLAIVEEGQADKRKKYIIGDIWELTGAEIREVINSQPTIQPEPHWIPVTERLPEKSGRYFVTERIYHINDKEHTGGFILKTDFAEYSATEKKWRRAQALVVVAWMDNEPYKGVTNGN